MLYLHVGATNKNMVIFHKISHSRINGRILKDDVPFLPPPPWQWIQGITLHSYSQCNCLKLPLHCWDDDIVKLTYDWPRSCCMSVFSTENQIWIKICWHKYDVCKLKVCSGIWLVNQRFATLYMGLRNKQLNCLHWKSCFQKCKRHCNNGCCVSSMCLRSYFALFGYFIIIDWFHPSTYKSFINGTGGIIVLNRSWKQYCCNVDIINQDKHIKMRAFWMSLYCSYTLMMPVISSLGDTVHIHIWYVYWNLFPIAMAAPHVTTIWVTYK